MHEMTTVGAVVLSAGKGTRLNCVDIPKVMLPIGGKPIVSYTVATLLQMKFPKDAISLVVGFHQEKVREYFKDTVTYAEQTEQKGTAHAAYTGMKSLPARITDVLVMGGDDSAFYKSETLLKLIERHRERHAKLTLLTAMHENPAELGRIVRHPNGEVEIVEKEYLTEEQKQIKEISTGTFVFNREWFEKMYPTMPPLRKLGEYGLPTALAIARKAHDSYQVIKLEDSNEWFGVNTPEELVEAKRRKGEK